jgi:beta-lactamase superfamily II metal-dependent hydrolase
LYSGSTGKYFNRTEEGNSGGDGIYILSPTKELVSAANDIDDYNDCSYVLLYISSNRKILLAGDSHDETWEHIIETHEADVTNVDLLIAPHHGRDSDMDFSFLDTLNPKVTLFGNAKSKHLAYSSWNNRGLFHITNNQAGNVIVDINEQECSLYVTNYKYAKDTNDQTTYSDEHNAYYVGYI